MSMKAIQRTRIFRNGLQTSLSMGIALLFLTASGGCFQKEKDKEKNDGAPVVTATAVRKSMPLQLGAIGNVVPFATVAVKSQIGGTLQKVHFTAGQDVKKGDLLFTIDPRPFEASLRQVEATLAKDVAQMTNAQEESRRYRELLQRGYVSQQQYDQYRTAAAALESVVQADHANVEAARLQLSYCSIYSPISGRTGDLLVDEGNVIKAIDENLALVTINQVQPVYVRFSLPEQYLADINRYLGNGPLQVGAYLGEGDKEEIAAGKLSFIDNSVDTSAGTISLKGTFDNSERRLWPGQFVHVVLTLARQDNALVIPSQAVQAGQNGSFVYVVQPDMKVAFRPVTVNRSIHQESVIDAGIDAGEEVVIEGQMRLTPGAKVQIREPSATAEGRSS
jgi:multidrug efflux system membrane fusion protein